MEEFSKNFNWVNAWSKTHLKYIFNIIIPFISVLIFIIFYVKIKFKNIAVNNNNVYGNRLFLSLVTSGIGILSFFFFFSIYRYGYSYIITFISLSLLAIIKNKIPAKNYIPLFKFVFICCLTLAITKSAIKIYKKSSQTIWPNIYTLDSKNQIYKKNKVNIGNNFFYYLADEGDGLCMYSASPCTSYPMKKNIGYKQRFTYTFLTWKD